MPAVKQAACPECPTEPPRGAERPPPSHASACRPRRVRAPAEGAAFPSEGRVLATSPCGTPLHPRVLERRLLAAISAHSAFVEGLLHRPAGRASPPAPRAPF
eukprot:9786748-Alexandrium_andersonii.AAC.2